VKEINENKYKQNKNDIDDRHDIADSYFRIYGDESLSSHFPEPEIDRYP
jgi:hypothetical protein